MQELKTHYFTLLSQGIFYQKNTYSYCTLLVDKLVNSYYSPAHETKEAGIKKNIELKRCYNIMFAC